MATETGEGQALIEKLKDERPDVCITVSREVDDTFVWDGDGPDPEDDGYLPYDVDVVASTIRAGVLIETRSSLGGSYFEDDEETGEIHGYLPQMVREALARLDKELSDIGV
jgi:hypothetical protein